MKILLEFTRNNVKGSIEIEAADLDTCKNAAWQWRAYEQRLKGDKIEILSISEIK